MPTPVPRVEQALQAIGTALAQVLGQLPSVIPLH